MQNSVSLYINSGDTSKQLELAVPTCNLLPSGEFVCPVAETQQPKVELKAFDCELKKDFATLETEEKAYEPIPIIRQVDQAMAMHNYNQINWNVKNT